MYINCNGKQTNKQTGATPGLTTGVGLPEPATRPIEAKYRAILGPYLLDSRDIAGIFDPGICAPIFLDWQSGEPSPLGTRPSVRRLC